MFLKSSYNKYIFLFFITIFLFACVSDNYTKKTLYYYNLSLDRYQRLLKMYPNDINIKLNMAKFLYELHNYKKVIETLENVDTRPALILLVKSYVYQKEYNKAIEIFEKLGKTIADDEYLYLYGITLEKKNLFSQAIEIYKSVGGEYKEKAQKRISKIKVAISKEEVPQYLRDYLSSAKGFISKYKDEEAFILFVDENIEISSQNTSVVTVHMVKYINKERGRQEGEIVLTYDSTYDRLDLDFARTITPDGKIFYAGKENIRDVNKYLNYPLYSNVRAFIISMPKVSVGSIIEYKFRIYSSKLIMKDKFSYVYPVRDKLPIYHAKFNITLPTGKKLRYRFLNNNNSSLEEFLKPRIIPQHDRVDYRWEFRKIPPLVPEKHMPPFSYINEAILISNFSSWDEIFQWWSYLYEDKLALTSEMKDFVDNLIAHAKNRGEKARLIYEYCSRKIRYVAVEYGEGGYEPHFAKDVFLNGYGDCKDQAILLTAMLRYAGFKAYPVLIPTDDVFSIIEDFPSLNFNHAITALQLDGKLIFMDPTSDTISFGDLPFMDQNRLVLVFTDKYKLTTTPQFSNSKITTYMDINIDDKENALIKRVIESQGNWAGYYRSYIKYTHPLKIEEDIKSKMHDIAPDSELIKYTIENIDDYTKHPRLIYTFKANKFLNPAGRMRIVPFLDQLYLDISLIGKKNRRFPIDWGMLFTKETIINIQLPDRLSVKVLPSNVVFDTKWYNFQVKYTQQDGNRIRFYEKLSLKKRFVEPDEYVKFRESMEEIFYALREQIILEQR